MSFNIIGAHKLPVNIQAVRVSELVEGPGGEAKRVLVAALADIGDLEDVMSVRVVTAVDLGKQAASILATGELGADGNNRQAGCVLKVGTCSISRLAQKAATIVLSANKGGAGRLDDRGSHGSEKRCSQTGEREEACHCEVVEDRVGVEW